MNIIEDLTNAGVSIDNIHHGPTVISLDIGALTLRLPTCDNEAQAMAEVVKASERGANGGYGLIEGRFVCYDTYAIAAILYYENMA